jgi:hypothetical protein
MDNHRDFTRPGIRVNPYHVIRFAVRVASVRLCARYRQLSATGKKLPVVVAAIARELAAFL